MKKVAVVGSGAYMDSGYGCPGEWRCLNAAALGEGEFDQPVQVIALVKCACPGRTVAPNLSMASRLAEIKPEVVYLSTCLAKAAPNCPYVSPDELAEIITAKTGLPVIKGSHDYH